MNLRGLALVLLSCSFSAFASVAERHKLEELLNSPTRPTLEQVRQIRHLIPADAKELALTAAQLKAPFDKRINIGQWLPLLLENSPKLIAAFEMTYPGATWYFLGRDSLPFADYFEAFYQSLGQMGRVKRIGMSRPTLKGASDKLLLSLLKSHGFSMSQLESKSPVVFIDTVSSGYGTQGRALMAAIHGKWKSTGHDPLDLISRTGMIGMMVSTFQGIPQDYRMREVYFMDQALRLLQAPAGQSDFTEVMQNLSVLTIPQAPNAANEAGYTHFLGAWHDSYGPLVQSPTGAVLATLGPSYDHDMKLSVLWTQKAILDHVDSGAAWEQVRIAAHAMGFEFPTRRPRPALLPLGSMRALYNQIAKGESPQEAQQIKRLKPGPPTQLEGAISQFLNYEASVGSCFEHPEHCLSRLHYLLGHTQFQSREEHFLLVEAAFRRIRLLGLNLDRISNYLAAVAEYYSPSTTARSTRPELPAIRAGSVSDLYIKLSEASGLRDSNCENLISKVNLAPEGQ